MIFIYSSCLHYNDHSAPKIVRKNLKKGEIITSKKVFKHYNLPTYDDFRFSTPGGIRIMKHWWCDFTIELQLFIY